MIPSQGCYYCAPQLTLGYLGTAENMVLEVAGRLVMSILLKAVFWVQDLLLILLFLCHQENEYGHSESWPVVTQLHLPKARFC